MVNSELSPKLTNDGRKCMSSGVKKAGENFGTEPEKIPTHFLTAIIARDFLQLENDDQRIIFNQNLDDLLSIYEPEIAENIRGKILGHLNIFARNHIQTNNVDEKTVIEEYAHEYGEILNIIGHVELAGKNKLKGEWINIVNTKKETLEKGHVTRRKFLKSTKDLVLGLFTEHFLSKLGLSLYDKAIDAGYIESEEGLLLANLQELKQIPVEDLQLTQEERAEISRDFATWIFPESQEDQAAVSRWLFKSGLEGVANTAKILMLTNKDIYLKHSGSITTYLKDEYLPEIKRLCDEFDLPRLALIQFLEYNGAGTYAYSINSDMNDLTKQAVFGAINTLVAYRLKFELPVDAINLAGYYLPDDTTPNVPNGAYKSIRALYPTGTPIGLEYGALARGITTLKEKGVLLDNSSQLPSNLIESSLNLTSKESDFETQHSKLVQNVEKYCQHINEGNIEQIWRPKFNNKNDKFWKDIGLGGNSTNIAAILYQLTNYTVAWEVLVLTNAQDLTIQNLQNSLNVAQSELMSRAGAWGIKKGIESLLFDQLKNPIFREELQKIAESTNDKDLADLLMEYNKLDSLVIPFRDALARNMYEFNKNQFIPDVQNETSIGTMLWLDEITENKELFPTLFEFRDNPYCRSFFALSRREITELNKGLVPEKGIRFRDVNMPLQSLDHGKSTLKNLDELMKKIKDKIQPYYGDREDMGGLVLDIMCREMLNENNTALVSCFNSIEEYLSWKTNEFNPAKDKLLGWFVWSGTHLALDRYRQIKINNY